MFVNGHLAWYRREQTFKYEDLRVVMMLFEPNEWTFSFDLKSSYHHIDVWHNRTMVYRFVVLPFGLLSASNLCFHKDDVSIG